MNEKQMNLILELMKLGEIQKITAQSSPTQNNENEKN